MKKKYPYSLNILIAVLSVTIGIAYISLTLFPLIEKLKCVSCSNENMLYFRHYWYRWALYLILIVAGLRLHSRLLGTRRLYYLFFSGAIIVAILDGMSGFADMNAYGIALDIVIPITLSIVGVIYFKKIYTATLKYR